MPTKIVLQEVGVSIDSVEDGVESNLPDIGREENKDHV